MHEHIINISGGKDSTATYLLALERGKPFRAITAETDNEHPLTDEYIDTLADKTGGPPVERFRADFSRQINLRRENLPALWSKAGIPDDIIQEAVDALHPTGNVFIDLALVKGRFPGSKSKFCTQELKIKVIENQVIIPAMERGNVVQWLGVRRDESKARANTPKFRKTRWIKPKATLLYYYPVVSWTWQDVFDIHKKHNIDPNQLYSWGTSRVGCWPCIFARKDEINTIRQRDPDAVKKLMHWEAIVTRASKRRGATFFPADKTPAGAQMIKNGHVNGFPNAEEVFDWSRTKRGGKQYDLFADTGGCVSEYGMCE